MGLPIGPWLRAFKEAMLRGKSDETLIDVAWRDRHSDNAVSLPLGLLKKEIRKITAGRKIAYVVDCSFTDANVEKIVRLAKDADILFNEATLLEADAALAKVRHQSDDAAGRNDRAIGRGKAYSDFASLSSL
jgi:ribonuclease Z